MYHEVGPNYFDEHDRRRGQQRLVARLTQLGYRLALQRDVGQLSLEPQSLVNQSADKGTDQPVLSVP